MNRYIEDGKCPICYGHGTLVDSDGDEWPCHDCRGIGTLEAFWARYNQRMDDIAYLDKVLRQVSQQDG